jgi:hypothetical protein
MKSNKTNTQWTFHSDGLENGVKSLLARKKTVGNNTYSK